MANESALEEKIEETKLNNQLLEEEYKGEVRRAQIRELKKKYGKNWRSMLGGLKDSQTIKQLAEIGRKSDPMPKIPREKVLERRIRQEEGMRRIGEKFAKF